MLDEYLQRPGDDKSGRKNCILCQHFQLTDDTGEARGHPDPGLEDNHLLGWCKRRSPSQVDASGVGIWPGVEPTDSCGDFELFRVEDLWSVEKDLGLLIDLGDAEFRYDIQLKYWIEELPNPFKENLLESYKNKKIQQESNENTLFG